MKLLELFDSKPRAADLWYEVLNDLLGKHDLEEFHGGQARVITSKDRKHVYRFWKSDFGYEKWLKVALTMQSNPHVVKILGKLRTLPVKTAALPQTTVKFIKLEKLAKVTDPSIKNMIEVLDQVRFRSSFAFIHKQTPAELHAFALSDEGFNDSFTTLTDGGRKKLESEKKFVETYFILLKKGYNDLQGENIMMRGDTIVVCDPLMDYDDE